MNNSIVEPNHTQIPNVLFDYWMRYLSPSKFKVLLYFFRTPSRDFQISLKELAEKIKISKMEVIRSIKLLEDLSLINVKRDITGRTFTNVYNLNLKNILEVNNA